MEVNNKNNRELAIEYVSKEFKVVDKEYKNISSKINAYINFSIDNRYKVSPMFVASYKDTKWEINLIRSQLKKRIERLGWKYCGEFNELIVKINDDMNLYRDKIDSLRILYDSRNLSGFNNEYIEK